MRSTFLIATFALLLSSCDPHGVFDQYQHVEGDAWSWHHKVSFEVDMADTTSLHNMYIQIRHTVDYPMSNLYLFVDLEGPGGQQLRDTINLVLAAPDGQWMGRGNGKYRELALLYREQIVFAQAGNYRVTLEQAMRKNKLPVTEVGLRIERINP